MSSVLAWKVVFNHLSAKLKPLEITLNANSLDAVSREYLPGGAYTTFRTYQQDKSLYLADHFARLEETARLADSPIWFDHDQLRRAIREAIRQSGFAESRIRVTLDLEVSPGAFYISLEPLKTPSPTDYQHGVKLVTVNTQRFNPKAKLTDFISIAAKIRVNLPGDVNDGLLYGNNGQILEGMTSNFFAIRNGEIWTADEDVLSGITRASVLDEARKAGFVVHLKGIQYSEIKSLEEAFITSASRGVLPVQKIDEVILKVPGQITGRLAEYYQRRIEKEIKPI